MNEKDKIEIFEIAFRSGVGHSRMECVCGKVFYNSNGRWDWEDGELEELKKSNATDLDYTVGSVFFEEKEYCLDCDCWHKRALVIFESLVRHNHQIAELFSLCKKTKQEEVDNISVAY